MSSLPVFFKNRSLDGTAQVPLIVLLNPFLFVGNFPISSPNLFFQTESHLNFFRSFQITSLS